MSPLIVSAVHLAIAATALTAVWLLQLRTRNAGIVDAVWPLVIAAGALLYATAGDGDVVIRLTLALLSLAWALRLSGYLALRNRGPVEERRYAELRRKWGESADRKMLLFFLFQAAVAWLLALTYLPIAYRTQMPPDAAWMAGILLCLVGILGEGIADHQLRAFKRDPRNRQRVCDQGLWRYSRHPNYFFECLHWAGFPLLALQADWAVLSLIGPVLITVLLLKLSGIPTIEARQAVLHRPGYEDYVRRTSAFVPWPPRKNTSSQ
ncbi:MAG TPA: DUF1295 domain-containing protein [Nevskiales bacterium]|nr:DUF1295 domain-containing protein [Nevskiales bacterium]